MRFKNYFRYLKASILLVIHLQRQKWYLKKVLEPILQEAESTNDGSLTAQDFKKIRSYYALFVVAILGENYCTLRGRGLTKRERRILTFQGALTGLYDDFFDHPERINRDVKGMMRNPFNYPAKDSVEKLFLRFLQEVHQLLREKDKAAFEKIFDEIYEVQLRSQLQVNSFLTETELRFISRDKGGLSHLFYRITLDHPLDEIENETIFLLGYLLQQVNDLFDLWKDYNSGISTFATNTTNMRITRLEYETTLNHLFSYVHRMNYPKSRRQDFFIQFMIFFGMGLVCLNQYVELQNESRVEFSPALYTRKQLVCDMHLRENRVKLKNICKLYDYLFEVD